MNKSVVNTLLAAIYSLRVNKLRAIITMLIIALGIASLVGMQTAIDGLKWSLVNNLNTLGNNTFSINRQGGTLKFHGRVAEQNPAIDYRQALRFKSTFPMDAKVSISANAKSNATARYRNRVSSDDIPIIGGDEFYLNSTGFELEAGRNFTLTEQEKGAQVVIIGRGLNDLLFSSTYLGIGKVVYIADRKFTIIGVTKEKGSSFGMSFDQNAVIPLQTARKNFPATMSPNFDLKVTVSDVFFMEDAVAAATGAMRVVRKLRPGDDNNFGISRSESLRELLEENLSYVSYAALIIGLITLLGALIALMNIMFVSITERTREIGTRMAVGASSSLIRLQFLSEATVISLLGGCIGIILGLFLGNVVIVFLEMDANLPYQWIFISFILCALVGIAAGYLPAQKAASLDPIESLRYE